jgi:hypothetical protein
MRSTLPEMARLADVAGAFLTEKGVGSTTIAKSSSSPAKMGRDHRPWMAPERLDRGLKARLRVVSPLIRRGRTS